MGNLLSKLNWIRGKTDKDIFNSARRIYNKVVQSPGFLNKRRTFLKGSIAALTLSCTGTYRPPIITSSESDTYKKNGLRGIEEIVKHNLDLAIELKKIPEITSPLRDPSSAIKSFIKFYVKNKENIDKKFLKQIKDIEGPKAKYNSLLQALYWMIEDGNVQDAKFALNNFDFQDYADIKKFLNQSWGNKFTIVNKKRIVLEQSKRKYIINEIKGKKGVYVPAVTDVKILDKFILSNYENNRKIYSKKSKEIIKDAIDNGMYQQRMGIFERVVDMLNHPYLVDIFEKEFFNPVLFESGSNYQTSSSPKSIFNKIGGNCDNFSTFTVACLKNAGYSAGTEWVKTVQFNHFTSWFKNKGKYYIFDVNYTKALVQKSIFGPYKSLKQALNIFLTGNYKIPDKI